jgi:hypothetical protein
MSRRQPQGCRNAKGAPRLALIGGCIFGSGTGGGGMKYSSLPSFTLPTRMRARSRDCSWQRPAYPRTGNRQRTARPAELLPGVEKFHVTVEDHDVETAAS